MTFKFDPPGFLDDLSPAGKNQWHDWISERFDAVKAGSPGENDGPRAQFFNPAHTPPAVDAVTEVINWTAFPRQVEISSVSDLQRWRRADASRMEQDEYCEWSVHRDAQDKITRIDFTCEGPEYWGFLAASEPQKVLDLYRLHINPQIVLSDLFRNGVYNPRNRFNSSTSDGAMHLIQPSNTLGAEIELAAGASIVRLDPNGTPKTGSAELIACSGYGAPERHSDPHIGDRVNTQARSKSDITLANPVGLYFHSIDLEEVVLPGGGAPLSLITYARGTPEYPVRMTVAPPTGSTWTLSDVNVDGRPIKFGAQLTDRIQIKLVAMVTRIGQSPENGVRGCRGDVPQAGLAIVPPMTVAETLARQGNADAVR